MKKMHICAHIYLAASVYPFNTIKYIVENAQQEEKEEEQQDN